jgi:hypothetical protein
MNDQENISATFPFRFLKWFCPHHLYEAIEGDLIQRFQSDWKKYGEKKARRRIVWSAIRFFRPGILLRNKAQAGWLNTDRVKLNPFASKLNFKMANTVTGWIVFSIAMLTYFLTVEETASFWDCSEFIATSYKLQVPHPPGAPLFLLMGRIFSFFAFGDRTSVAYAMNMMSALASAFTILFLFWSIVLFGRKMMGRQELTEEKKWLLLSSGMVGALAYAFSDSFWFSAVEAEVYALSSLSTAIVVWGILKWESVEDKREANRWLILIAYVIGLSIGVHLLNLLTLPALALVYYFKTFKTSALGILSALAIGGGLVLCINDLIIPGLPSLAGHFELFFVNTVGLFFGSGAIVFSLMLIGLLFYGIRYTGNKNYAVANTFILAVTFILIGYGSYATILIRSNFDPPINENAPKDIMSFVRYLKREQYVIPPLLFGPYFTSQPIGIKQGPAKYVKGKDKYETRERKRELEYDREDETVLPRVWDPDHKEAYQSILGLKEGQKPTFAQNMYFMVKQQIGVMYVRYFMWNFAGRESDEQGADWLRPAEWFKSLPSSLASNKARNNFFMIPFVLGLIGMFYQFVRDTKNFFVIALLFMMLGVAIVLYLNSPPTEPRERDYIYVGSYYAFAFWIGLAVIGLSDVFVRIINNKKAAIIATSLIGMAAPVLMVVEGWDDHDRSNRFFSVDSAANVLNSCDPNGILFTGGDNDTFPLWYAQETENCRTDLRVLVLSYCNGDWYIDQTTRPAYASNSFSYTLPAKQYRQGGPNDYLPYAAMNIKSIDATQFLDLLAKENPHLRQGDRNVIPSKLLTIDIDKKAVLAKGIVPAGMENWIVDQMQIKLLNDVLEKRDLMFLDLLVTANWDRPIYLDPSSIAQLNMDLKPYIVLEGNAYRILPVRNPRADRDYLVNTEKTYDVMINKFRYRGLDDPTVYYTNDYRIQVLNHRSNLNSLAQALIDEGKVEKAGRVLSFSLEKMPDTAVPYDPSSPDTVNLLFKAGQKQKAVEVATVVANRANEVASYLLSEGGEVSFELRKNMYLLGAMQQTLYENGQNELAKNFEDAYTRLISNLQRN